MTLRKRLLSAGWYPGSRHETEMIIEGWRDTCADVPVHSNVRSVVVPHAGWFFSGLLAYSAIRMFDVPGTVVVIGGHLAKNHNVVVHVEDGAETPLGPLYADVELRESIEARFVTKPDSYADNTIEVHLPLIKYLFPSARYVGIRTPPSSTAIEVGKFLADWADKNQKRVVCIGSTDLTHYGPAYDFEPAEARDDPISWAEENDRAFLRSVANMDFEKALLRACMYRAACSAGAAVTAGSFARNQGAKDGKVTDRQSSAAKAGKDSFVGYGVVVYCGDDRATSA